MSDVNPLHSRAAAAGTIAELERALATALRERDEAMGLLRRLADATWSVLVKGCVFVTPAEWSAMRAAYDVARDALPHLPSEPREPATGMKPGQRCTQSAGHDIGAIRNAPHNFNATRDEMWNSGAWKSYGHERCPYIEPATGGEKL